MISAFTRRVPGVALGITLALLHERAIAVRSPIESAALDEDSSLDSVAQASDTPTSDLGHLGHLSSHAAWAPSFSGFLEQVEANRDLASAALAAESQKPSEWPKAWRGKLRKAKMVGQGAFGKVYVAGIKCAKGQSVAVKEQTFKTKADKKDIQKEVELMALFSGPEFVSIFDASEAGKSLNIMMEAASGDLGAVMKTGLRTRVKFQLFAEMLRGVAAMHEAGFIHRDLKPANILISGKCGAEPCHAKVADLGLSCSHSGKISKCEGIGGTPMYMAPETYRYASSGSGMKYIVGVHSKNDVWALGLIFYEMLFGHAPRAITNARSMNDVEKNIKGFKIESDEKYKNLESDLDDLKELFRKMLASQPKDRWSATEALSNVSALASRFGADVSQAASARLPDCWHGIKPVAVDADGEEDEVEYAEDKIAEDKIIFLTFASPMTNMEVNMLAKSWNKDGVINIPPMANDYSHKGLRDGDVIEEIAGVAFSDITDDTWSLIKEGAFGANRNAPLVVKLRRKR